MTRLRLQGCLALVLATLAAAAHADEWRPVGSRPVASPPPASAPALPAAPAPIQLGKPAKAPAAPPAPVVPVSFSKPMAEPSAAPRHALLGAPTSAKSLVRAQNTDSYLLHSPRPVDGPPPAPEAGRLPAPTPVTNPIANTGPNCSACGPTTSGYQPTPPGAPANGGPNGNFWGGVWDWCSNCCDPCKCGLRVGAGVYVVQPFWESNPAYVIQTVNGVDSRRQQDFNVDASAAPIVWLSLGGENGIGVRARWWHFDQQADELAFNDGGATVASASPNGLFLLSTDAGDHLTFDSELRASVIDLEVIEDLKLGCWTIQLSGGGRFGEITQTYNALRFNPATDTAEVIASDHRFQGFGPTAAVLLKRPIPCTCFSMYSNLRASLLFGTGKQEASRTEFNQSNPSGIRESITSRDDLLPITELEVGVEYNKCIGHCRVFVQVGLAAQIWFGAGNAGNSDLLFTAAQPGITSDSDNSNLGFFGLNLQAGLDF